jgi:hypothetical protein
MRLAALPKMAVGNLILQASKGHRSSPLHLVKAQASHGITPAVLTGFAHGNQLVTSNVT